MRARSPGRPSSAAPYAKSGWPAGRTDRLTLNPMWPESLGALRMPIFYRGHRLHLTISGRSAELSVEAAEHPAIEIECRGTVQTLQPGTSLRLG